MDEQFWLFCNSYDCRVDVFYVGSEDERDCPACDSPGDAEAQ